MLRPQHQRRQVQALFCGIYKGFPTLDCHSICCIPVRAGHLAGGTGRNDIRCSTTQPVTYTECLAICTWPKCLATTSYHSIQNTLILPHTTPPTHSLPFSPGTHLPFSPGSQVELPPGIEPLVLWEPPAAEEGGGPGAGGGNAVVVDDMLTQWLRPHQREGVQFMFECVCGLRKFDGQGEREGEGGRCVSCRCAHVSV